MKAKGNTLLPWSWIAETYLGMDIVTDIAQIEQELEQEIQDNIMSKTMPKMKLWQKKTSKGKKESETPTAKSLKKTLDDAIGEFCKLYTLHKISPSVFKNNILVQQDQTVLSQFLIVLYKNGKTVKVTKSDSTNVITPTIEDILSSTEKWKAKKPPTFNPFSKKSKTIILEGKQKELVRFHLERKHALEWDVCVACKAIRAFIQWEFHQPGLKTKESDINSGVSAAIVDKLAKAQQAQIEAQIILAAAESPVIHNITVKSLKEDDLLSKSEIFDLDNPTIGDVDGSD